MKIIKAYPPNYVTLKKNFALPPGAAGVVFAWGDKIYAPRTYNIAPEIVAHEEAHGERQIKIGVDVWWQKYVNDLVFRLEEEIIGHRAELKFIADTPLLRGANFGPHIDRIATKLAAPIYGCLISFEEARKELCKPS